MGIQNGTSRMCGGGHFALKDYRPVLVIILCLVSFLLWKGAAGADNHGPALSASLNADAAELGDTVVLTLTYRLPEGGYLPENVTISGLEALTVLEKKKEPGRIRIKLLVDRLKKWGTGSLGLPFLTENGEERIVTYEPVSLDVVSVLGDTPESARLKPIRGIMPTRSAWLVYLPWAIGALVVLAVGGPVFLWWYRKRRIHRVNAELLDPPHVRTRKALDRLDSAGIFEKGQVKAYFFQLSEILRQYLGTIREFPAAELTTEEIALRVTFPEDRQLVALLRQADLVKFANAAPTDEEKAMHLQAAYTYVGATAPREADTHISPAGKGRRDESAGRGGQE
jgi:hypothetical protein